MLITCFTLSSVTFRSRGVMCSDSRHLRLLFVCFQLYDRDVHIVTFSHVYTEIVLHM